MCKDLELFDYVKYVGSNPTWKGKMCEGIILGIDSKCDLNIPFLVVKDKERADELVEIAEEKGLDFFQTLEEFDNTREAQEFLESLGLEMWEFDFFGEEDLEGVYFDAFDALSIMLEELRKLTEKEEGEETEEVNKYLNSTVETVNGNTFSVGDTVKDDEGQLRVITFIEQEDDDDFPVQAVSLKELEYLGLEVNDFISSIYNRISNDMSENKARQVVSENIYFKGVKFKHYSYFNPNELVADWVMQKDVDEGAPIIYVASPLSTEGDILFVNEVTEKLREAGLNVYSPIEDESINDKSNDPDPEDIFVNDYVGIEKADYVFLVETGREQVGTHVELGIVLEKIISGKKNRVYAKEDIYQYYGEEGGLLFLQGERYEYITDGNWYYLISEQGNIETYMESEMKRFFEFEKVPDLFVYVNNKRLQEPQVKYGKPSASMNQLALGGIMEFGTLLESDNLVDAVSEFAEYVEVLESKALSN